MKQDQEKLLFFCFNLLYDNVSFTSVSALVNKGNVLYARNDFEKAREFFKEALTNDSSCIEALYNLGKTFGCNCSSGLSQSLHDARR